MAPLRAGWPSWPARRSGNMGTVRRKRSHDEHRVDALEHRAAICQDIRDFRGRYSAISSGHRPTVSNAAIQANEGLSRRMWMSAGSCLSPRFL